MNLCQFTIGSFNSVYKRLLLPGCSCKGLGLQHPTGTQGPHQPYYPGESWCLAMGPSHCRPNCWRKRATSGSRRLASGGITAVVGFVELFVAHKTEVS